MPAPMIAFLFPGQGAQKPQMGLPWVDHPSWELVDEATRLAGRDVSHLLLEADAEELRQTRNSQLATFVTSMIALDAVSRVGVDAAFFAGHSLGEYSALTAAGTLSYSAGLTLVTERGDAMQAAADTTPGTMAAILGLEDEEVDLCCSRAIGDVWIANYNTPGQVVVAGSAEAIEAVSQEATSAGAKRVLPIKVGGAFHTSLMSPARDRLVKALAETELRSADKPVYANVDAQPHTDANDWEKLLAAQLTSPVRWRQTMDALAEAGANVFVELGAGKVISGMTKRTVPDSEAISVGSPADVDALLERLANAAETVAAPADVEGESLYAVERLVISPVSGIFEPTIDLTEKTEIKRGLVIGTVGDTEVRSPFEGTLQGLLALKGEKVNTSQPLAWLRLETN